MKFISRPLFLLSSFVIIFLIAFANNSYAETTPTTPPDYEITLPTGSINYPIMKPQSGRLEQGCNSGIVNLSKEWSILQWNNNSHSLCEASAATSSTLCPGADLVRGTPTMRFCSWYADKKTQLSVDSNAMPYNGCAVSQEPGAYTNPGGYSIYLSWSPENSNLFSSTYPSLGEMDKLLVNFKQKTDAFSAGVCPSNISPDPHVGSAPNAFSYVNVVVTEIDPQLGGVNTMFYQIITYDNRRNSSSNGQPIYFNCGQVSDASANGFMITTDNVGYYNNQPYAMPGGPEVNYSFDVLPRIKYFLQQCRPGQRIQYNRYKVTVIFVGSEIANTTLLTATFRDPIFKFVHKPFNPVCASDVTKDGRVNLYDYNEVLTHFFQTGTQPADINKDTFVDLLDYVSVTKYYAQACE